MKTAVLTDSASNIPKELVEKYDITVLPITIIFGETQYRDGVDMSAQAFLDKLADSKQLPTTAQVSMGQMQEAFDNLSAQGYDEVICVNLSSGITTFYENLVMYSKDVTNIKVYPFDSLIASAGEANLTLLAAKMAQEGHHADTILPKLELMRDSMKVAFVVDSLSHLMRTGRISNASALIGSMLRIKPLLTFEKGKIVPLSKERTMKQATNKVMELVEASVPTYDVPVRISVVDANNPKLQNDWLEKLHQKFPDVAIDSNLIGPAISVHTGTKAMGIIWSIDWEYLSEH
ncbi:DegV family protein [Lentilactobacillus laojiaonis]|uniref:DegV family protein n=1 Tax=Lentilactobacillus laojiaonis TaxID=2883998 RepID=UPI001D0B0297|nr:DegV family protein [Lentilactobacillus laojiaonis]UDM32236.1 DegV family protein [Lentilactobacillus laojiaonis]